MKFLQRYFVFIVLLFGVSFLICGYLWYEFANIPFLHHFWRYTNNGSVVAVLTFILALSGFGIWNLKRRKNLYDEYLKEYVMSVIRWYTIKKEQTDYRRREAEKHIVKFKAQQNKKDCTEIERINNKIRYFNNRKMELDSERVEITGYIHAYKELIMILQYQESLNIKVFNDLTKEFERFGEWEKNRLERFKMEKEKVKADGSDFVDEQEVQLRGYKEINDEWDVSYEEICSLISKLKM